MKNEKNPLSKKRGMMINKSPIVGHALENNQLKNLKNKKSKQIIVKHKSMFCISFPLLCFIFRRSKSYYK